MTDGMSKMAHPRFHTKNVRLTLDLRWEMQ